MGTRRETAGFQLLGEAKKLLGGYLRAAEGDVFRQEQQLPGFEPSDRTAGGRGSDFGGGSVGGAH